MTYSAPSAKLIIHARVGRVGNCADRVPQSWRDKANLSLHNVMSEKPFDTRPATQEVLLGDTQCFKGCLKCIIRRGKERERTFFCENGFQAPRCNRFGECAELPVPLHDSDDAPALLRGQDSGSVPREQRHNHRAGPRPCSPQVEQAN